MHRTTAVTKRLMAHNAHFVPRHKMGKDYPRGVVSQCSLHYLARVHQRTNIVASNTSLKGLEVQPLSLIGCQSFRSRLNRCRSVETVF